MANIITNIFAAVGQAVTSFSSAFASGVESITSIFYTANETGGSLTFLGTLLCVAMGVGLVYWAFRLIRGLIRNRG